MDKALIPKLRFPEFRDLWTNDKLGNLALKVNSGKTPLGGESVYVESGVIFIRSQNVNDNQLNLDNVSYIPESINQSMKNSIVKPNDILLNITGASLGRSCVVPKDFNIGNVNQHVCIIRLNDINEPRFIQSILSSVKGQNKLLNLQTGSGREGLNFDSIKKYEVNIPSLKEQQKIASFLTAVDTKLQALRKKKELLEQYKKGVMQKIFSQELRFKDEEGKAFQEWKENRLGKLGYTYNGITGKNKEHFGKGKRYIQYKQIFDSAEINIENCGLVDITENEKQNQVQYGDIFFTISSETPKEIGMSSVFVDEGNDVYLNSFCFGFRPNSLVELVPEFSKFLFRSDKIRNSIVMLAQGSTRYNMSKNELMKLKVKIPCQLEQVKIATFLNKIDSKLRQINTQILRVESWKKGLLQKMFC